MADADIIFIYEKGSLNRYRLQLAADWMNELVPDEFWGERFRVDETWFDYGAGLVWSTILYDMRGAVNRSVQGLSPRQQSELLTIDTPIAMGKWVQKFFDEGIASGHTIEPESRKGNG